MKWQYRRVQSIMAHGVVLQSSNVSQMARENPRKGEEAKTSPSPDDVSGKLAHVSLYEEQAASLVEEDAGAVVFLFPPPKELAWSFARTLLKCKIWLLDLLSPVHDEECNMKVLFF